MWHVACELPANPAATDVLTGAAAGAGVFLWGAAGARGLVGVRSRHGAQPACTAGHRVMRARGPRLGRFASDDRQVGVVCLSRPVVSFCFHIVLQ